MLKNGKFNEPTETVNGMILTKLKESTRQQHEQIEKTMNLLSRLHSVESYVALLGRFYGFYAPLEARLGAVEGAEQAYAAIGFDFAKRCKTHQLRADLMALGMSADAIDKLPLCSDLPQVDGMPEAMGCWYVLEGSTLGGQIIRREVSAKLGFVPGNGCSFFSAYGDQLGPMWKSFGAAIEKFVADSANLDCAQRVLSAASDTFVRLDVWVAKSMAC